LCCKFWLITEAKLDYYAGCKFGIGSNCRVVVGVILVYYFLLVYVLRYLKFDLNVLLISGFLWVTRRLEIELEVSFLGVVYVRCWLLKSRDNKQLSGIKRLQNKFCAQEFLNVVYLV